MTTLKQTREDLYLSAKWCAEHCPNINGSRGVTLSTWKHWEAVDSPPDDVIEWLGRLGEVLHPCPTP